MFVLHSYRPDINVYSHDIIIIYENTYIHTYWYESFIKRKKWNEKFIYQIQSNQFTRDAVSCKAMPYRTMYR